MQSDFWVHKYDMSYGIILFDVVQGLRFLHIPGVPLPLSLCVCVCLYRYTHLDKHAQVKCNVKSFWSLTVNKLNHIIATWSTCAYSWIMVPRSYHAHVGRSALLLVIFWAQFKVLALIFTAWNGFGSGFLRHCLSYYESAWTLRSEEETPLKMLPLAEGCCQCHSQIVELSLFKTGVDFLFLFSEKLQLYLVI